MAAAHVPVIFLFGLKVSGAEEFALVVVETLNIRDVGHRNSPSVKGQTQSAKRQILFFFGPLLGVGPRSGETPRPAPVNWLTCCCNCWTWLLRVEPSFCATNMERSWLTMPGFVKPAEVRLSLWYAFVPRTPRMPRSPQQISSR